MKKTLLLDVDEVICFSGFLEAVNEFMETNYSIDDFTDYYIDEVAIPKERQKEFLEFIKERNFYQNPHMLPGAVEAIKKLSEFYEIYICSSCVNDLDIYSSGKLFKDKYDFLVKTLPFLKPKNFIFTGAKKLIKADIQIDDLLPNLNDFVDIKILFPSYHNKDVTDEEIKDRGVIRAGYDWRNGWEEVSKILLDNLN